MIYGSVCSGIEAASVAWSPLGWQSAWLSEIEKFPNLILAHHYPDIPNLGDMTKIYAQPTFQKSKIDLIVGGTPCQSFSVAGLRKGLDDPRGNLCLEFLRLVDIKRPRWFVWENVPGVLSSSAGRDFGSFLGAIQKLGYGFAYRILDAQYFGVPQRRRRVFVVGYLGDARPACAVLFERQGLLGNTQKGRKTGKSASSTTGNSTESSSKLGYHSTGIGYWTEGAGTLRARKQESHEHLIPTIAFNWMDNFSFRAEEEQTNPLRKSQTEAVCITGDKTHTLKAEGFDASEDGTGRGQPIVAFSCKDSGLDAGEKSPTLRSMNFDKSHANAGGQIAILYENYSHDYCHERILSTDGLSPAINVSQTHKFRVQSQVRRLTPRECERLQGFPDDYTLLPNLKKPADGPRYKALGNSMAVPVMRWIGKRIQEVDDILSMESLF